jgi:hypothetical protein
VGIDRPGAYPYIRRLPPHGRSPFRDQRFASVPALV